MEQILLFPTMVLKNTFEVSDNEKLLWFDAYLKNSNKEGKTHDFLGYETVHHEETLSFFFKDKLVPSVKEYMVALGLDAEFFDIHLTKTFFNVSDKNGINEHDHAENHISFVYYPNIAKGKERDLIFYHPEKSHGNEPYTQWFESNVINWNFVNARSFSLGVSEGLIYIFPSKLAHNIKKVEGDTSHVKGYRSHKELSNTRFCVAGDMIIAKKERGNYKRTLPPVSDWRSF
jgi:hypothetical protein